MSDNKRLIENTPSIRVSDLGAHIRRVSEIGEDVTGIYTVQGEPLDLSIVNNGDTLCIEIEDNTIILDGELSNLVPNATGRWYFLCPQCAKRYAALYRPTTGDQFACRVCHDLTYRSKTDRERSFLTRVAKLSGIDPVLLHAFRDAMRGTK